MTKLDFTFARDVYNISNGDGTREARFAFMRDAKAVAKELSCPKAPYIFNHVVQTHVGFEIPRSTVTTVAVVRSELNRRMAKLRLSKLRLWMLRIVMSAPNAEQESNITAPANSPAIIRSADAGSAEESSKGFENHLLFRKEIEDVSECCGTSRWRQC